MTKRVLITGGAGFIGSNFVHYLTRHYPDYEIIILDSLTYAASAKSLPQAALDENNPQIRFWYGNICNAELMDSLVAQSDYVVHLAAETHVTRSIFDNLLFFQTDVIGTQAVANAIAKAGQRVERYVHVSTSEVYGTAHSGLMDEDHPLNPMSPYASAKCGADRLVHSYWATYRIPAVILRPFNNFGPRQHLEKVVPRFVTSVLLDEELTVHGDGAAARDFVFVEDTCRAIDLVMHAPEGQVIGEVFNVASGQHRSIRSIADDVVQAMGADPGKITHIGDRPGQVIRHSGDASKIQERLGWQASLDWETGLRDTIEWYRENQAWWEPQIWMRKIPIMTASGKVELH